MPAIIQRNHHKDVYQSLLRAGFSELQATIIANRTQLKPSIANQLADPKLSMLDHPNQLLNIDKAADRIIEALTKDQIIGIETDHDCDGQTAHAVLYETLTTGFGHQKDHVQSYIGHRLEEGYGLSQSLAQRIINSQPRPDLIITADNGSSDEPRIALLKAHNIDTIVTDHHAIPVQGPPESAYAVINPTQDHCRYPDPYIAGCMVAWLLMVHCRTKLKALNWSNLPDMREMLDYVAVGTLADCVSMANSVNNRAIVKYGLKRIAHSEKQCWKQLRSHFSKKANSEYIGFQVAPLLNSDGRLSDAFSSVNFLLCHDANESRNWVAQLYEQNEQRKIIQQQITQQATEQAIQLIAKQKNSLCIHLENGHPGIHGISASRLKEQFGRPTILFSPQFNDPEVLSGSARSIDSVNIKSILDTIAANHPGLMVKYGGHHGAAGLSIRACDFNRFCDTFESAISTVVDANNLGPVIKIDGQLMPEAISSETMQQIKALEPFGRDFEYPVFKITGMIVSTNMVGKERTHAQLTIRLSHSNYIKGIWFNCQESIGNIHLNQQASIIGALTESTYQSRTTLTINIQHIEQ